MAQGCTASLLRPRGYSRLSIGSGIRIARRSSHHHWSFQPPEVATALRLARHRSPVQMSSFGSAGTRRTSLSPHRWSARTCHAQWYCTRFLRCTTRGRVAIRPCSDPSTPAVHASLHHRWPPLSPAATGTIVARQTGGRKRKSPWQHALPGAFQGGDDGNRTHDILLAKQVLCQLSYVPMLACPRTDESSLPPTAPNNRPSSSPPSRHPRYQLRRRQLQATSTTTFMVLTSVSLAPRPSYDHSALVPNVAIATNPSPRRFQSAP